MSRQRSSELFGGVLVLVGFSLYYWQKLHYDPYLYDYGWLSGLLGGGFDLNVPAVPYGSFYSVHTSPTLSILSALRSVLGVDQAVYTCVFMGFTHALFFYVLVWFQKDRLGDRGGRFRVVDSASNFLLPFSLSIGIAVTYPHFEYIALPLFMVAILSTNRALAGVCFLLAIGLREDFAITLGVVTLFYSRCDLRNQKDTRWIRNLAYFSIAYGVAAFALRFIISGPGSTTSSISLQVSPGRVSENLGIFLGSRTAMIVVFPILLSFHIFKTLGKRERQTIMVCFTLGFLPVPLAGIPQVAGLEMHYGIILSVTPLLLLCMVGAKSARYLDRSIKFSGLMTAFIFVPLMVKPMFDVPLVPFSQYTASVTYVKAHVRSGGLVSHDIASLVPNFVDSDQVVAVRNYVEEECFMVNTRGLVENSELTRLSFEVRELGPETPNLGLVGEC